MCVCVCVRERERERGNSNSGEQKLKCNCEAKFSSKFLSLLVIRGIEREHTHTYIRDEEDERLGKRMKYM